MKDVFQYSFQGSVESHLKELEAEGLVTKKIPKSGAPVWHADPLRVMEMVKRDHCTEKKEEELMNLKDFLDEIYGE
jgi:hypothetical protein